ncbi:hypothetical protein LSH36_55g00028 [Paralvinella palmiformis]|uniref:Guanylate cyclase domain-containing protein n=1 Tax=Paralvinella palmiformis TaxID=53620 RepID=A0AAD9K546_9ANNE|nr:hypothetical protein LSH36_55g00028 [Paralvinella palmiformis]
MAKLLNDIEEFFDERIRSFNVYKLETMGESHMVVSGIPEPIDDHSAEMADFALDLMKVTANYQLEDLPTGKLNLRIGIHSGM